DGLVDWPGGLAAYAYGLAFHAYLAEQYGADRLTTLSDATARSVPWFGLRAFGRVYGSSLSSLWRDFQAALVREHASAVATLPSPRRLTRHAYLVSGPRYLPKQNTDRPEEVV